MGVCVPGHVRYLGTRVCVAPVRHVEVRDRSYTHTGMSHICAHAARAMGVWCATHVRVRVRDTKNPRPHLQPGVLVCWWGFSLF